jgi:hypothetical protein
MLAGFSHKLSFRKAHSKLTKIIEFLLTLSLALRLIKHESHTEVLKERVFL